MATYKQRLENIKSGEPALIYAAALLLYLFL